jgi:hypothetical protein
MKLVDEGARRDVSEFANASASARRRDAKTIVVTSDGTGSREMLVSYTIAAPIWKTTYRVVLDQQGKPFFQGWAIVDNVGEEDWNNISLSLVSGTPVSFIQPIQKPFYRYRPVVPMPTDLKLAPQTYEPSDGGAMLLGRKDEVVAGVGFDSPINGAFGATTTRPDLARVGTPNAQNGFGGQGFIGHRDASELPGPPARHSIAEAMTGTDSGVEAAAKGSEVGDLFEYKIDQPVSVPHDRSALIPILQTRMDGERVSIYNEGARRDRPLGGMLLKNTTPLTLEDGSVTIIDGDAYAGEALMERLKPGEERLISFALDLGTIVNVRSAEVPRRTYMVKAVNGVFEAYYYQTNKKIYTLTNQTDKPRVVVVEHPVQAGWKLSEDTPKPDATSARYYRFRVALAPHQKVELPVMERRALMENYALSNFTRQDLELFISRNYVDAQTQAMLERIIDLKSNMAGAHARVESIDKEIAEIGQDQERLRDNIKALTATAEAKQLIARYVAKAGDQETRLEQLNKDKQAANTESVRLESELEATIKGIAVDHPLTQ